MDNKIVYGWFANEECFYVGIGSVERSKSNHGRNKHCLSKRKKAEKEGTFVCKILFTELTTERAIEIEKDLIRSMGRRDKGTGTLTNMTDGGDGRVNPTCTSETKLKLSNSNTGKTHTKETKEKISQSLKGKRFSINHKKNISESLKGEKGFWHGKKGKEHTRSRKVVTPLGEFDSVKLAAKAHNMYSSGMSRKLNNPKQTEFYHVT